MLSLFFPKFSYYWNINGSTMLSRIDKNKQNSSSLSGKHSECGKFFRFPLLEPGNPPLLSLLRVCSIFTEMMI